MRVGVDSHGNAKGHSRPRSSRPAPTAGGTRAGFFEAGHGCIWRTCRPHRHGAAGDRRATALAHRIGVSGPRRRRQSHSRPQLNRTGNPHRTSPCWLAGPHRGRMLLHFAGGNQCWRAGMDVRSFRLIAGGRRSALRSQTGSDRGDSAGPMEFFSYRNPQPLARVGRCHRSLPGAGAAASAAGADRGRRFGRRTKPALARAGDRQVLGSLDALFGSKARSAARLSPPPSALPLFSSAS